MTYCNSIPIAAACYLKSKVVSEGLNSIFNAIYDLINLGKNISMKTGFCNIFFIDKNMTYTFNPDLKKEISKVKESENKVTLIF